MAKLLKDAGELLAEVRYPKNLNYGKASLYHGKSWCRVRYPKNLNYGKAKFQEDCPKNLVRYPKNLNYGKAVAASAYCADGFATLKI